MYKNNKGFTLIELLVVCAIIGILATIIMLNLAGAKENSKVASAVSMLNTVRKAAELYRVDTRKWPTTCRSGGTNDGNYCDTDAEDRFVANDTANPIPGWSGPYFENGIHTMVHPWGGAVNYIDWTTTANPPAGSPEEIVLDDDRAGQGDNDNGGGIPESALIKIDNIFDNGNGLLENQGPITRGRADPVDEEVVGKLIGEIHYKFSSN